jgi:hypothetical protein
VVSAMDLYVWPSSQISRPKSLLFLPSSSSLVFTRLSGVEWSVLTLANGVCSALYDAGESIKIKELALSIGPK